MLQLNILCFKSAASIYYKYRRQPLQCTTKYLNRIYYYEIARNTLNIYCSQLKLIASLPHFQFEPKIYSTYTLYTYNCIICKRRLGENEQNREKVLYILCLFKTIFNAMNGCYIDNNVSKLKHNFTNHSYKIIVP